MRAAISVRIGSTTYGASGGEVATEHDRLRVEQVGEHGCAHAQADADGVQGVESALVASGRATADVVDACLDIDRAVVQRVAALGGTAEHRLEADHRLPATAPTTAAVASLARIACRWPTSPAKLLAPRSNRPPTITPAPTPAAGEVDDVGHAHALAIGVFGDHRQVGVITHAVGSYTESRAATSSTTRTLCHPKLGATTHVAIVLVDQARKRDVHFEDLRADRLGSYAADSMRSANRSTTASSPSNNPTPRCGDRRRCDRRDPGPPPRDVVGVELHCPAPEPAPVDGTDQPGLPGEPSG